MHTNNVLGVLLLWVALSRVTFLYAAGAPDCTLKRHTSLDLAGDPSRSLVVPVTLDGSHAFMVLNTADGVSSVTESTVRQLSLQTHPLPRGVEAYEGKKRIQANAWVKTFELGNLQFSRAHFAVVPDNTVPSKISGLLGMDTFAHFDIEVDIANRKVNLYSQDHCPGHVVYWSKTYDALPIRLGQMGEFYFPMQLDGKKIETSLDTGDANTTLSTDVSKKYYGFDANSPNIQSITAADGRTTSHYRVMQLNAPPSLSVINANITLIDPFSVTCRVGSQSDPIGYDGCFGPHPLQLGLNVLAKLHVYIATKEKVLYFTPAVDTDHP